MEVKTLKALDIVLSQQPAIYFSGQYVEGIIIVHNTETIKARSIKVTLLGCSHASLEDPGRHYGVLYTAEKAMHLEETAVVWGEGNNP